MTEWPPRPTGGEFHLIPEYDTSDTQQMTELKLGAFAAIHSFLDEYESSAHTHLSYRYEQYVATRTFFTEFWDQAEPDEVMYLQRTPQAFLTMTHRFAKIPVRTEVVVQTTASPKSMIREKATVSLRRFALHSDRPLVNDYVVELLPGGAMNGLVGHHVPRLDTAKIEVDERAMTPYDYDQLGKELEVLNSMKQLSGEREEQEAA